jgi:hypothetical protein
MKPIPQEAVVAEWLRRLTRNQIPSGSVGSSPTDREIGFFFAGFNFKRWFSSIYLNLQTLKSSKKNQLICGFLLSFCHVSCNECSIHRYLKSATYIFLCGEVVFTSTWFFYFPPNDKSLLSFLLFSYVGYYLLQSTGYPI